MNIVDLIHVAATPAALKEEYLFVPSRLKFSYLLASLNSLVTLVTCDEALEKRKKREKQRQDSKNLRKRGVSKSAKNLKFDDFLEEALRNRKKSRKDALGLDSTRRENGITKAKSAIVFVNTRQS